MLHILRLFFLTSILIISPLFSSATYANNTSLAAMSPCGVPDTNLENLTKFFSMRWKAIYADLPAHHVNTFLDHFELNDRGIVLVRVFHSQYQQNIAVVAAKRIIEYDKTDKKMIAETYCIVPVNGSLIMAISSRHLGTILKEGSPDI